MAYIFEWLVHINTIISDAISPYLADSGFWGFFQTYPLYLLLGFFMITAGFAIFVDFIKDSWKIPIAIIGDVLDVIAMQYPGTFDIIAALYSSLVFYILASHPKFFQKSATFIVFAENIIGIDFPFPMVGNLGSITNVLPTNTILMFIATIID